MESLNQTHMGVKWKVSIKLTWTSNGTSYGVRSSVVSTSEFKPEDPGFDPMVGKGEGQFFYPSESTIVQTRLIVPDPLDTHPNLCAQLKIPYSSVVKE